MVHGTQHCNTVMLKTGISMNSFKVPVYPITYVNKYTKKKYRVFYVTAEEQKKRKAREKRVI